MSLVCGDVIDLVPVGVFVCSCICGYWTDFGLRVMLDPSLCFGVLAHLVSEFFGRSVLSFQVRESVLIKRMFVCCFVVR